MLFEMTGGLDASASAELDANWQFFLLRCVEQLVKNKPLDEVLDWAGKHGPVLLTSSSTGALAAMPFAQMATTDQAKTTRWAAWSVARALPLPHLQFKPMALSLPGRNDPCLCGSLKKFKHCCAAAVEAMPPLSAEILAAHLFDALPRKSWKTLPLQKVNAQWVLSAAATWLDLGRGAGNDSRSDPLVYAREDRLKDAQDLLAPWMDLPAPWPEKHALLYDLLGDIYLTLDKPRKRKALAQRMVERGEPAVQSLGWQRLALMACDAGDDKQAREAMTRAVQLAPNDPRTALFEVNLLTHWGQESLARQRADFHARRFQKMKHDPDLQEVVEGLQHIARHGLSSFMLDTAAEDSTYGRLSRWLDSLPPAALALDLTEATAQDLGMLRPNAAAHKALTRWRAVFDLELPHLNGLNAPPSDEMDFAHEWLPVLEDAVVLGDCFEVLDGLVLLLQQELDPAADTLVQRVLERGAALWALLAQHYPRASCLWGGHGNRPALRLLSQCIERDETALKERTHALMAHLVWVLNPHDNQGYREPLIALYLRKHQVAEALSLCKRYPDDGPGMDLLHALALQTAGQTPAAVVALHAGLSKNQHLRRLLNAKTSPAEPSGDWITVGSKDEAHFIMHAQFDLWQSDEARALLKAAQITHRPS